MICGLMNSNNEIANTKYLLCFVNPGAKLFIWINLTNAKN